MNILRDFLKGKLENKFRAIYDLIPPNAYTKLWH